MVNPTSSRGNTGITPSASSPFQQKPDTSHGSAPKDGASSWFSLEAIQKAFVPAPPHIDPTLFSDFKGDATIIQESPQLWLLTSGALIGGMGLGMHDFANAMGTTVGAQILTFGQARIMAGSAMLYGATFGGAKTAKAVAKHIFDPALTSLSAADTQNVMSAALLGSGVWIVATNAMGIPISTTQSTIGGIIGPALIADAIKTNDYSKLMNGADIESIRKFAAAWGGSLFGGAAMGATLYGVVLRPIYHFTEFNPVMSRVWHVLPILSGVLVAYGIGCNDTGHVIGPLAAGIYACANVGKNEAEKRIASESGVHQWLNVMGAWFVIAGMWNFGGRLTDTLGSRLGGMNPAKAIAAEVSTAIVLNFFKSLGIPVSSSQTIVASVAGVMLGSGNKLPLSFLRNIVGAWVLSIPVSAALAAAGYATVASLSSIDRDAPAVDAHDAHLMELGAVTLMRLDRPAARLIEAMGLSAGRSLQTLRRLPIGALGLLMAVPAVRRAGQNGPLYAAAEIAKLGIELMPLIGGAFQFVDGLYALKEGKSLFTNLETSAEEATLAMLIGGSSAILSAIGSSGRARAGLREAVLGFTRVTKIEKEPTTALAKREKEQEDMRKDRAAFIEKSIQDGIRTFREHAGIGPAQTWILRDTLRSMLQHAGKGITSEVAVYVTANRLLRTLGGDFFRGTLESHEALELYRVIHNTLHEPSEGWSAKLARWTVRKWMKTTSDAETLAKIDQSKAGAPIKNILQRLSTPPSTSHALSQRSPALIGKAVMNYLGGDRAMTAFFKWFAASRFDTVLTPAERASLQIRPLASDDRSLDLTAIARHALREVRKHIPEGFGFYDSSVATKRMIEQESFLRREAELQVGKRALLKQRDPVLFDQLLRNNDPRVMTGEAYVELLRGMMWPDTARLAYAKGLQAEAKRLGDHYAHNRILLGTRTASAVAVRTIFGGILVDGIEWGIGQVPQIKQTTHNVGRWFGEWANTLFPFRSVIRTVAPTSFGAPPVPPTPGSSGTPERSPADIAAGMRDAAYDSDIFPRPASQTEHIVTRSDREATLERSDAVTPRELDAMGRQPGRFEAWRSKAGRMFGREGLRAAP